MWPSGGVPGHRLRGRRPDEQHVGSIRRLLPLRAVVALEVGLEPGNVVDLVAEGPEPRADADQQHYGQAPAVHCGGGQHPERAAGDYVAGWPRSNMPSRVVAGKEPPAPVGAL